MAQTDSPLPDNTDNIPVGRSQEQFIDTLGIGFFLWFIGYIASIILYFLVPPAIIGRILFIVFTPVIIVITLVRFRKRALTLRYYTIVSLVWTGIAIVADFLFIVLLFNPDNYYHLSVFCYYIMTFLVPLIAGILYRPEA